MDKTFQLFRRMLTSIGVSFFNKKKSNPTILLIHQLFNFMIGLLTMIFTSGFVIVNAHDRILLIEGACIWSTGIIAFISLIVLLIFRRKIQVFLDEMVFKDSMVQMPLIQHVIRIDSSHLKKLDELKQLVNESQEKLFKYTRMVTRFYLFAVLLSSALYNCDAIYQFLTRKDLDERPMAFPMWFPWSLEDLKIYMASSIFIAYSGFVSAIAYPGFQCTIVLLIGQVIRQLKILTYILLNLDELSAELAGDKGAEWQIYCTEILKQSVKHYVMIKRFSNRLNVICRPFYLVLILNATMMVCVSSVKIAISDKLATDTMKHYVHETFYILMVMMLCLLAQQVDNQSEQLEQVVTEKWYIFDREHQVNVMIFKMALNQRMPIYIFGTVTMSNPTFTWFIQTGMSFFTLVMSVLDE